MLPPDYLSNRADRLTKHYEDLQNLVVILTLLHLQNAMAAASVTALGEFHAIQHMYAGMLYNEVLRQVKKANQKGEQEAQKIIEDAANASIKRDNTVYTAAGLIAFALMQTPSMRQILAGGISGAKRTIDRLTNRIASTAQAQFDRIMTEAHRQRTSGSFDTQYILRNAADDLSCDGVRVYDPATNKTRNIVSAIRSSILTEANQTAASITEEGMRESDIPLVLVSAHVGARNTGDGFRNHESWQGRVYYWREIDTDFGEPGKYPDFVSTTGYGDVAGLCGINCRHSFIPYVPSITPNIYDSAMLDEFARKTVTYRDYATGRDMTIPYYNATQTLRSYERKLRHWELRRDAKEAIGETAALEIRKVRQWEMRTRSFAEQTGIHGGR